MHSRVYLRELLFECKLYVIQAVLHFQAILDVNLLSFMLYMYGYAIQSISMFIILAALQQFAFTVFNLHSLNNESTCQGKNFTVSTREQEQWNAAFFTS